MLSVAVMVPLRFNNNNIHLIHTIYIYRKTAQLFNVYDKPFQFINIRVWGHVNHSVFSLVGTLQRISRFYFFKMQCSLVVLYELDFTSKKLSMYCNT